MTAAQGDGQNPAPPVDPHLETDEVVGPADKGLLLEALSYEIALGATDDDPFDSTMLLATNTSDGEVAMWVRLTPTVITDIIDQLESVFREQRSALGMPAEDLTDTDSVEVGSDDDTVHEIAEGEGKIRRVSDVLGLRYLRERSPKTTVWAAVALGSLLLLSVAVRWVYG